MDASPCDEAEQGFFCPICYEKRLLHEKVVLSTCHHQFCHDCLVRHFTLEITESRVDLHCPTCSARVPPHEVQACTTAETFNKYLDFTLRKCLVGMKHVRFCPAPDCPYAEISLDLYGCPPNLFQCRRPGCMRRSCYRCKGDYHTTPCQGESMGRPLHSALTGVGTAMVGVVRDSPPHAGTTELGCKRCPHCDSLVEKIEDGSCNHMTCVCCGRDFCWLCLHPAGGMHFLRWASGSWAMQGDLTMNLITQYGLCGLVLVLGGRVYWGEPERDPPSVLYGRSPCNNVCNP